MSSKKKLIIPQPPQGGKGKPAVKVTGPGGEAGESKGQGPKAKV